MKSAVPKPQRKTRTKPPCPFCRRIRRGQVVFENSLAVAIPDATPLSKGHTLILPRRHETEFFSLSKSEESDIWRAVRAIHESLNTRLAPQGYNIGINVGSVAGQTIGHVHVHLIPRYEGDVEDPRGGVRWIIPARAPYWKN